MQILKIRTEKRALGDLGEKAAAKFLRRSGYCIKKRNFVAAGDEIDLIAESKDTVAFVEVKTRTIGRESANEPRPASAVTPDKQRKIIRASRAYHPRASEMKYRRFDVVEVLYDAEKGKIGEIRHLKNAFTLDTAYPKRT